MMSIKKAPASVDTRALEMHNASLDKSIVARKKGRYNLKFYTERGR